MLESNINQLCGDPNDAINESRKSLDRLRTEVERLAELLEFNILKHSHPPFGTNTERSKDNSRKN